MLFSPFVLFRIRIEHRFLLDTMLPEKFPDIELGFRRNAIFFAIVTIIKRFRKVEDHYFPQMPCRPIRDFFQQVRNTPCNAHFLRRLEVRTCRIPYREISRVHNPDMPVERLTWAPEADERDRIDFIYYIPATGWEVKDAVIVGPKSSIIRSQRVEEDSQDVFSTPAGVWPTDHKGVLIKFKF